MRLNFTTVSRNLAQLAAFSWLATGGHALAAADTVASVKQQIVEVAQANQTRRDNISDVRSQLDPLVAKLLTLVPPKPEAAVAAKVAGGWRYLWSDQEFPPFLDFQQIYQVVSPSGYYYNISRQELPFGVVTTGLLRGKFVDAGDTLNIEFTRNAVALGWLAAGTKLVDIGTQAESGELPSYDVPGPIGVTGTLTNAYVDSDLRVIKGTGGFQGDTIFIMSRADTIAP